MSVRFYIHLYSVLCFALVQACDQVCVMGCLREPEFSNIVLDECVAQCDCGPPSFPGRCLSSTPVVSLRDCVANEVTQEWLLQAQTSDFYIIQNKTSCLTAILANRTLEMRECTETELWSWVGGPAEGYLKHKNSGLCLVVNATVTGNADQAGFASGAQTRLFACPSLGDDNYPIDFDVRSEWVKSGELNSSTTFVLKLGGGGAKFGGQSTNCAGEICLPPKNLAGYPSWMWAHRLMARGERLAAAASGPQPEVDVYDSLPQVASTWVGTQMMMHDRFFFDDNKYTVSRYLDDLEKRFGGIDQVLLWATYPNIGLDNRGAWDMFLSLPGGLQGLISVVDEFHKAGVMVMMPYHPFDAGTSWRERSIENSSLTDAVQMAQILNLTGADGFNGDTNRGVPYSFLVEGQNIAGRSIVLEPEQGMAGVSGLSFNAMSWNYGFQKLGPDELRVSVAKLIEPRHMGHICDRWSQDQTAAILNAFFNGFGFVAWENVWGMWNELPARTGELLRRVSAIQRHFSRVLHLRNDSFWPYFNAFPSQTVGPDGRNLSSISSVRATRFYSPAESLLTVVTGSQVIPGEWPLVIDNHVLGTRYFDVYHGEEIHGVVVHMCLTAGQNEVSMQACGPTRLDQVWSFENATLRQAQLCLVWDGLRLLLGDCGITQWVLNGTELRPSPQLCLLVDPSFRGRGQGAVLKVGACDSTDGRQEWNFTNNQLVTSLLGSPSAWLTFALEPLAIGAVFVLPPGQTLSPVDEAFFSTMRNMTRRSLSEYSSQWMGNLPQSLQPQKASGSFKGTNMTKIDGGKCPQWEFRVTGLELEGEDKFGVDVEYPWEKAAQRSHVHVFSLGTSGTLLPFFIDQNLVTNTDFSHFLNASGYTPTDKGNYLKHWGGGVPPAALALTPVVWVSRQDAGSYCAFYGKRLPEEWEWQLAAQGCDGRVYPWGNSTPEYGVHVPPLVPGRQEYNASPIGSFPQGASQNGILDLAGNVWQWTSVFEDIHTRAAILRGGTVFRPGIGGTGDPEAIRHDVNYMWFGDWYFPGGSDTNQGPEPWGIHKYPEAYQLQYHAKLLLMSPSLDRSGAIGFRCVASDEIPQTPAPAHWAWILVPIGALLVSGGCIGGLFYQRSQRAAGSVKSPLLKHDVNLPAESSYRSTAGYDADVSEADAASRSR